MSVNRRASKRSVVGCPVCAPQSDGLLYAGVIVSTEPVSANHRDIHSNARYYRIEFENSGETQTFRDSDIVGPGFQTLTAAKLKPGQTVYFTRNGREVKGHIASRNGDNLRHVADDDDDEMWVDNDVVCGWDEVWVSVSNEMKLQRVKVNCKIRY